MPKEALTEGHANKDWAVPVFAPLDFAWLVTFGTLEVTELECDTKRPEDTNESAKSHKKQEPFYILQGLMMISQCLRSSITGKRDIHVSQGVLQVSFGMLRTDGIQLNSHDSWHMNMTLAQELQDDVPKGWKLCVDDKGPGPFTQHVLFVTRKIIRAGDSPIGSAQACLLFQCFVRCSSGARCLCKRHT